VTQADWTNCCGDARRYYIDATSHLSTEIDLFYMVGETSMTAVRQITRGCACTLPTAIKEPENEYTTFDIGSYGDVLEKRKYFDTSPNHTQTPGSDLVEKAYFAR
jgi:hypothetical protein